MPFETGRAAVGGRSLIAVLSGKGGSGASVVTANLAALVAAEGRRPVVVVDLAGDAGDISALLNATPSSGWPATSPPGDVALLSSLAVGAAGVRVMTRLPVDAASVTTAARDVRTLFNAMRVLFDVVIVDVPRDPRPETLPVLQEANATVIVAAMSAPAARGARRLLGWLRSEATLKRSPFIVLNRNEANNDLTRVDVEAVIDKPSSLQLPYDPMVVAASINSGEPFVLHHGDAQVSRRIRDLAAMLGLVSPEPAEAEVVPTVETTGRASPRPRTWRRPLRTLSRRS